MWDHQVHYVHVYENKQDQLQYLCEINHDIHLLIEQIEQFPRFSYYYYLKNSGREDYLWTLTIHMNNRTINYFSKISTIA